GLIKTGRINKFQRNSLIMKCLNDMKRNDMKLLFKPSTSFVGRRIAVKFNKEEVEVEEEEKEEPLNENGNEYCVKSMGMGMGMGMGIHESQ
ncbi:hypothetical protein DOY81_001485, partial [Sarcophaga bullata]